MNFKKKPKQYTIKIGGRNVCVKGKYHLQLGDLRNPFVEI